jgi:hypothetical protein
MADYIGDMLEWIRAGGKGEIPGGEYQTKLLSTKTATESNCTKECTSCTCTSQPQGKSKAGGHGLYGAEQQTKREQG